MATAPLFDEPASTEIAVIVASNPAIVLIDAGKRDDLYAHIQREVDDFVPDLTTLKGREAIKSLAHKITRTKTAIDAAGKQLNEEARAKINVVDAARRDSKARLEAMAEAVRQPLTDWEDAEKARVAECEAEINRFVLSGVVTIEDTAESVRQRGSELWAWEIDQGRYGALYDQAVKAKAHAVGMLKLSFERLTREEADRAELAKLRAEAEARAEADRLAQIEAERVATELAAQAEAERVAVEQARVIEERRIAAEKAQEERIAQAAADAAAAAEREAERKTQAERERIDAEHAKALAAEKARADAIEADRRAEAEAALKAAAEQSAREASVKHRTAVKRAAKQAIMTCGASEDVAQKIVIAIIAAEIPAVSLRF